MVEYKEWCRKELNNIKYKIENNISIGNVEAMNLVNAPRIFDDENPSEILEEVCQMLHDAKLKDTKFKYELIFEMECKLHKYAKTKKDLNRLRELINVEKAIKTGNYLDNLCIKEMREWGFFDGKQEGLKEGKQKGLEEGKEGQFKIALKIKEEFGIEKAKNMTQFTYKELQTEIMNK